MFMKRFHQMGHCIRPENDVDSSLMEARKAVTLSFSALILLPERHSPIQGIKVSVGIGKNMKGPW